MIIRKVAMGVVLVLSIVVFSKNCFAIQLLTQEQALEKIFPEADEIVAETRVPTSTETARIKERLGGSLVYYQKGSKSEEVEEKVEYTFYFGLKDNQKTGVAVIEKQPGKWGTVKFIIVLDTATAKVKNLAVMSYKEKRGRPIARRNFLKQFIGKGSEDSIKVRKDIRAISGATISSDATCFAVKKVIALYEELFFKKEAEEEPERLEKEETD